MKKMMTALLFATVMSASTAFAAPAVSSETAFESFAGIEQLSSLSTQEKNLAGGIGEWIIKFDNFCMSGGKDRGFCGTAGNPPAPTPTPTPTPTPSGLSGVTLAPFGLSGVTLGLPSLSPVSAIAIPNVSLTAMPSAATTSAVQPFVKY
jgi:hypothetical protein